MNWKLKAALSLYLRLIRALLKACPESEMKHELEHRIIACENVIREAEKRNEE